MSENKITLAASELYPAVSSEPPPRYRLVGHETFAAYENHLDTYLDVEIDGVAYEIHAVMDVIDDIGDTDYTSDTLNVERGSDLHTWLGDRVDEIWALNEGGQFDEQ